MRKVIGNPESEAALPHPPAEKRRSVALVAAIVILVAAALAVRVRHDRSRVSTAPADLEDAQRRASSAPQNGEAQLNYGLLLLSSGRLDDADAALSRAAALLPKDTRPFVALSSVALKKHNRAEAKRQIEWAAQIDPNDPEIALFLGDLHLSDGELPMAVAQFLRATQVSPENPGAWKKLGVAYIQTTLYPNAYKALSRAASLTPQDWEVQYQLADTALKLGYVAEAKEAAARAEAARPGDSSLTALTTLIDIRMDASPDSLRRAESRMSALPNAAADPAALLVTGRIHLLQGRNAEAIRELTKALQIQPALESAYVYLSQAYSRTGRPDLARKASDSMVARMAARKRMMNEALQRMSKASAP